MDKNTYIGLLLMFILIYGYSWYYAPTDEEIAAIEAAKEAEEIESNDNEVVEYVENTTEKLSDSLLSIEMPNLRSEFGQFVERTIGNEQSQTIASDVLSLNFSNKDMPTGNPY